MDPNSPNTRYIPVPKWKEYHSWPSIGSLRWLIFNAKHNGLEHCLRRVGRRILINEQAFWAWVDQQKAS